MARILETVYQESAPRVEGGVIYGAKLIGLSSRNGRRYEGKALEDAAALYEGRKVYIDHPTPENANADRKFNDWAGVIENVKYRQGDGLYGDVVLRQESSYFKGIVEAASNPKFHKNCGFSHVAEGESRLDGETEIIESIKEVFSVDLVTDPASTTGVYESRRKAKPKTVKDAVECLPTGATRTKLIEMMDSGYLDGQLSMDTEKEPTDPLTQMSSLVKELIRMLGETLKALAMKKDTPAPAAPAANPADTDPFADPTTGVDDDTQATPEDEAKKKPSPFESLQRENAELKAKTLLLESGRQATPARIKALAATADAEQRELLESWPELEPGERPVRSPALIEGGEVATPEHIRERFASLLKK